MRVDPNYVSNLVGALNQSSSLEATLTNELSSGLRVTSLQDDPTAVAESTVMGSAISKDDTFVQTASGTQSMMQVSDSTLGEIVSQLTSAVSLAVSGSNGTLNSANIASVQQQLTGIRDQVLSLANTSYLGQALFAGSQGSVKPFTLNTSTSPATTSYVGDTNVNYVETPSGQKIQTNLAGSDVFGSGSTGVFGALNQLIADFAGGTASASAVADTGTLSAALSNVSAQRSLLDGSLSRLQATSTYAQTEESQFKVQQGNLVSADPASVATQLSAAETQNQALMSVMTALEKSDLFDYMQ
ncbi:flagellin N-terminal helical domain-containing protein [Edaphobacter dinghuensis]|uniref:Flagellar hook-associated protein FlgL n=1 Tax=Edaphobacter dinghuensis TaxID=1560005 RepID=A0A917HCU8_9BACT|nr:flagellin [Edaphobacter dinghuensis]GGG73817.1 flagellar hook-associated protein FlgL [Edaphobacter dinghuensis]